VLLDDKTTITKKERDVFTRLFDIAKPLPHKRKQPEVQSGSVDELETLPNPALKKSDAKSPASVADYVERFPAPLQQLAATAVEKTLLQMEEDRVRAEESSQKTRQRGRSSKKKDPISTEDIDPVQKAVEKHRQRMEKLLLAASTDVELWDVLEKSILGQIARLDLDKNTALVQRSAAAKTVTDMAEKKQKKVKGALLRLAVVGPNYPSLLVTAMRELRVSFPSSHLPFSILPAVKRLGRASYALGASTPLYNELIAATWNTYSDFGRIDELMQEMETGGLEFDAGTLQVLDSIRLEGNRIKNGRYGINRRAVWSTDLIQNGWRKVISWIPLVKERMEVGAERLASEQEDEELNDEQEFTEGDDDARTSQAVVSNRTTIV